MPLKPGLFELFACLEYDLGEPQKTPKEILKHMQNLEKGAIGRFLGDDAKVLISEFIHMIKPIAQHDGPETPPSHVNDEFLIDMGKRCGLLCSAIVEVEEPEGNHMYVDIYGWFR